MPALSPFQLPPGHPAPKQPHAHAPDPVPYIASDELVEAVNLAIHLNRPLLLEGEAGSGKSQLAEYLAYSLGLPFYPWLVRSTSTAQDGLYSYDAILRLHDVQVANQSGRSILARWRTAGRRAQGDAPAPPRDPQQPMHYVTWGALGKAFRLQECPAVVLIDEIDKAEMDFPNDLLTVLDAPRAFSIREADQQPIQARHPPIVIITSNKEKTNLPAPFLRRCVYSYIRFPSDPAQLKQIIAVHRAMDAGTLAADPDLIDAAVERFLALRAKDDLFKPPGTSELLDWLRALGRGVAAGRSSAEALIRQLRERDGRLPCPEALIKLRDDWKRYVPAP